MKPDPFNILPRETFLALTTPVRKNSPIVNRDFASVFGYAQTKPENEITIPAESVKRSPLPDGTGQIINLGI